MAKIFGVKPICFVQGQSFDIRYKFNEQATLTIDTICVRSNDIDLDVVLQKTENDEFTYRIPANKTAALKPQVTTFDVQVNYIDGSVAVSTGNELIVKKRQNPPKENNNGE